MQRIGLVAQGEAPNQNPAVTNARFAPLQVRVGPVPLSTAPSPLLKTRARHEQHFEVSRKSAAASVGELGSVAPLLPSAPAALLRKRFASVANIPTEAFCHRERVLGLPARSARKEKPRPFSKRSTRASISRTG